jgi:hypothetical protein
MKFTMSRAFMNLSSGPTSRTPSVAAKLRLMARFAALAVLAPVRFSYR